MYGVQHECTRLPTSWSAAIALVRLRAAARKPYNSHGKARRIATVRFYEIARKEVSDPGSTDRERCARQVSEQVDAVQQYAPPACSMDGCIRPPARAPLHDDAATGAGAAKSATLENWSSCCCPVCASLPSASLLPARPLSPPLPPPPRPRLPRLLRRLPLPPSFAAATTAAATLAETCWYYETEE